VIVLSVFLDLFQCRPTGIGLFFVSAARSPVPVYSADRTKPRTVIAAERFQWERKDGVLANIFPKVDRVRIG
jgi:hypothetical protein